VTGKSNLDISIPKIINARFINIDEDVLKDALPSRFSNKNVTPDRLKRKKPNKTTNNNTSENLTFFLKTCSKVR
jgi:hypothetical protein